MLEIMLRESRENLDLKEKDVAKALGLSNKTISGYENCYDIIPMKRLISYANTYNLSLDYLFGIIKKNKEYEKIEIDPIVIGKNLKKLRLKHKKTSAYVANKICIATGAYSNYETGKYLVSVKCIEGLIKLYGQISVDEIFNRKLK